MERSMSSDTHKLASKDVVKATSSKNKNPSSWEPIDDILLRHLKEIKKMGWKEISQYFENRTPNACQFRWRRLKSGNLKSNKTALMDVTIFPGEIKILNPCVMEKKSSKQKEPQPQPHQTQQDKIKLPIINPQQNQMPPPPTTNTVQLAPLNFTSNNNNNNNNFNANRRNSSITSNIIHNNNSTSPSHSTFSPRGSISLNQQPSFVATPMMEPQNSVITENEPVKKFVKPRSYSHTLTSYAMTPANSINSATSNSTENENVGFIPKVFVRSRRSSSVLAPTSPTSATQSFNSALNTTLTTSKSRKNSFVNYQRRYSLAAVSSTSSSRRSSVIAAPNSMSVNFNNYQLPTVKQRRESIIRNHKSGSISGPTSNHNSHKPSINSAVTLDVPVNTTHLFNHNYSFTDMPNNSNPTSHSKPVHMTKKHSIPWSIEEDQLLLENKYRNLSLPELSILLPNRSESDIDSRLNSLHVNVITSQANENAVESSSSSNSPTPQLQIPEYASPIHSPKRSLLLNQSDSIINSQEYKDHLELGAKRIGTAQSQASSSKEVSPSAFSQTSPDNDTASSISSVSINGGNIKTQDYSTLLRSARQTSNDHSSLPHHHDHMEHPHNNTAHPVPQQQQHLPSINSIFQRI